MLGLDHPKITQGVLHCPQHMTLAFNLKSLCNALQLGDRTRSVDWSNKVFAVRSDRDACTRVPNNWKCCGLGKGFPEAISRLESHAEDGRVVAVGILPMFTCTAILQAA